MNNHEATIQHMTLFDRKVIQSIRDGDIDNLLEIMSSEHGSFSNKRYMGWDIFFTVIRYRCMPIFEVLIDKYIDDIDLESVPEEIGWRPLHCCVRYSTIEMMERMFELGCDVRARTTDFGYNILMLAAMSNSPKAKLKYLKNKLDTTSYQEMLCEETCGGYNTLDLLSINHLPTHHLDHVCAICLSACNYLNCYLINCGHNFHIKCLIDGALQQCPTCRDSAQDCTLCDRAEMRVRLSCGDVFHLSCMGALKDRTICPKCNKVLS